MALWVARAGRYGEREDLALQNNIAVIGWDDVGDLSRFQDRKELTKVVDTAYPEANSAARRNWVTQLWTFSNNMKEGDLVALPLKHRSVIAIGEVAGQYRFEKDGPSGARQVRPVKSWTELPRNAFKQDLLYTFGGASTVFEVKRNQAEQRVRKVLAGGTDTEVNISTPTGEPGDIG
jgi:restriction system protein